MKKIAIILGGLVVLYVIVLVIVTHFRGPDAQSYINDFPYPSYVSKAEGPNFCDGACPTWEILHYGSTNDSMVNSDLTSMLTAQGYTQTTSQNFDTGAQPPLTTDIVLYFEKRNSVCPGIIIDTTPAASSNSVQWTTISCTGGQS